MEHVSTMLPALSVQDQSGLSLVCSVPSSCQCIKDLIEVSEAVPQIFQQYAGVAQNPAAWPAESESGYISSSHIRLIRCLAVIGQASFTREHLV